MKNRLLNYLLPLALLLYSCSQDFIDVTSTNEVSSEVEFSDYEPGWIRVKFKELPQAISTNLTRSGMVSTGITDLDDVANALGATQILRVFNEGGKFKERREKYGLHLWYDFYVGENGPITRAKKEFLALPNVDLVETIPVHTQNSDNSSFTRNVLLSSITKKLPFNDPLLDRQWHYDNDGSTLSSIVGADANIFKAWTITTGNPTVIVAIMDGGIDFRHPDLAQNIWHNPGEIAGNGIDDDNNGYVDDMHGWLFGGSKMPSSGNILPMDHGSHCAGTVAAVNNNGIGLAGVAGGNGALLSGIRLMSCQTYVPNAKKPEDPYGNSASTSQTPDGFAYAADNGAVIINCSFSYGGTKLSSAYKAGIDYFVDNAGIDEHGEQNGPMRGGLVVASAGNDGEEIDKYPASYDRCLSVAYSMSNYIKSPSSNYGSWVDVIAPGGATSKSYAPNKVGGIFSTIAFESKNYDVQQGYCYKSGTSMAAPHVAGIAALIVSAAVENNIPMTVDKLRSLIEDSCWDTYKYNPEYRGKLGKGQVDAYYALKLLLDGVKGEVPTLKEVKATSSDSSVYLSWSSSADRLGAPISKYKVYYSLKKINKRDLENPSEEIAKVEVENRRDLGEEVTCVIDGLSEGSLYYFALVAVDRRDDKSEPLYFEKQVENEGVTFDSSILIYPSPMTEVLYYRLIDRSVQVVQIELRNVLGHLVHAERKKIFPNSEQTIDVSRLGAGIYKVTITYSDKIILKTVIKQ